MIYPSRLQRTVDEENYARRLIYEFTRGNLTDCPEATTLRAYLASKLRCAPMRISKKYAGQGIGKVSIHQLGNIFTTHEQYFRFALTFFTPLF